jgi:hypothetical protein
VFEVVPHDGFVRIRGELRPEGFDVIAELAGGDFRFSVDIERRAAVDDPVVVNPQVNLRTAILLDLVEGALKRGADIADTDYELAFHLGPRIAPTGDVTLAASANVREHLPARQRAEPGQAVPQVRGSGSALGQPRLSARGGRASALHAMR